MKKLENKGLIGKTFEVDAATLTLENVSQVLKFMSLVKFATV